VRLFTGIAIPDETRMVFEAWVSDLREGFPHLRWSDVSQWHVTLQFLGETDESRYSCVVKQLRKVRARVVDIQFAEPGFFERAGVFHVAVLTRPSLISLHEETEGALKVCGFEPEGRTYAPHITLARRKGRGRSPDFEQLQKKVRNRGDVRLPSFVAREFLLYQSVTAPSGSRYEVRERFPLM
jgi:2'-5' RNA ligase